jgi:hypothetical protein
VNGGALILTSGSALSGASGLISVSGVVGSGFTGGMLVLDGGAGGLTLNQGVTLAGRGPTPVPSGAALLSIGNNTLNGPMVFQASSGASAIAVAYGNTTLAGPLSLGTGTGQQAIITGNGNLIVTGSISSFDNTTNTLDKAASVLQTTLWLKNTANNFLSSVRVEPNTTVRVSDGRALGMNFSGQNAELNQGTLELRSDSPASFANAGIGLAANGGVFLDRAVGGSGVANTLQTGSFTFGAPNRVLTLLGRDGYGISLGTVGGIINTSGQGSSTITNSANGTVVLNGNLPIGSNNSFWQMAFGGNGDTVWNGTMSTTLTTGYLTGVGKSGPGRLILLGTVAGSGVNATTTITGGVLQLGTLGVLNESATLAGAISLNGGEVNYLSAYGETTVHLVNLAGTTGGGILLASACVGAAVGAVADVLIHRHRSK